MNKIIDCKILKTDFVPGINYMNWTTCPITQAVQRAGIKGEHSGGDAIDAIDTTTKIGRIVNYTNELPMNVARMCNYVNDDSREKMEPMDINFQVEIFDY